MVLIIIMKKQQVFYIHGGESFLDNDQFLERLRTKGIWDLPAEGKVKKWTDSLREDLGDEYEVFTPRMPNGQNAKYEEWKIWFERHFEYLRDDIVLVGYSLGAMFFSKYLIEETPPFKIKALFLLASPVQMEGFDDADCGSFVFPLDRVSLIAEKVQKVTVMHSKDDSLVPYEHGLKFSEALPKAEFASFTNKNHFFVEELPELLERIREVG